MVPRKHVTPWLRHPAAQPKSSFANFFRISRPPSSVQSAVKIATVVQKPNIIKIHIIRKIRRKMAIFLRSISPKK
jgi:hypothetical protein